jgi:Zn-dependent protease
VIGLTVGRIFGTDVRIHWTWVPIMAFIAVVFSLDLSSGSSPAWPAPLAWSSSVSTAVLVLGSVIVHELAHVKVARRNGQELPVVVVQLLGGPYVMELKPKSAGEEFRVAMAGSVVSLLLAAAFGTVTAILVLGPDAQNNAPDAIEAIVFVATMVAAFNLFLGVVNLVPGYPLDGARALHAIAWNRTGQEAAASATTIRISRYVGMGLIIVGAMTIAFVDPVTGLCLAVAGWLVMSSSRFLDRRSGLQNLIAGLHVSDAEDTDPARVPPQLTLDVFAADYLADRLGGAALVEHGADLLGLIGTAQIRQVPRRIWTQTRTEDAMVGIEKVPKLPGDTDLWSALEVLERSGLDALVVSPGGAATVLLTRRSVAQLVHEKVDERQRQLAALGQIRKNRFRGR